MTDSDITSVGAALRALRGCGISAHAMPALKRKTCDIVGRYRGEHYYVEVKERFGPRRPGEYELNDGYSNSVYKVIGTAAKQLRAMPDQPSLHRIIWFVIPDDDDDQFLVRGLIHTLYGVARVELRADSATEVSTCLFFRNSPLLKWPDVDQRWPRKTEPAG